MLCECGKKVEEEHNGKSLMAKCECGSVWIYIQTPFDNDWVKLPQYITDTYKKDQVA